MPGSTVPRLIGGRYELGELLGRGGMAEVYSGIDQRLARPVAVKLLHESMAVREDVRARFESEAQSAARLSHPAAVAVFDTGEHDGTPYIVMERLPGNTLADRIAAGPVDPEWMRRTAVEVLGALAAAHSAGLVHRDVKPGNILLTSDGHAKIGDFGIAKSVQETDGGGVDLTGTGQLVGTPAYLAPERIEGRSADAGTDLYALGVVMYEALAGKKPFEGNTPLATAGKVVAGEYQRLADLRPDLEPVLVKAVDRAMARRPADRFRSAAEMAGALSTPTTGGAAGAAVGGDPTVLAGAPRGDTMLIDVPPAAADDAVVMEEPVRPYGPDRRRRNLTAWLVVLAGLAILAIVILAANSGDDGSTTSDTTTTVAGPYAELIGQLRAKADSLTPADGERHDDLADGLHQVADQLEDSDGDATVAARTAGQTATDLVTDVRQWRASGELTDQTAVSAISLLSRVPGAKTRSPATTTATTEPSTLPPVTDPPTTASTTPTTIQLTLPSIILPTQPTETTVEE